MSTAAALLGILLGMGNVLDEIRKAMKASGKTRYRLWKETGIDQSHLFKLWNGKAGLSVENLEHLAEALELEIIIRPAKRKAGKEQ
ncbi:MAG: helix-turn-helix domain-containing protein [Phycisphaerae bacterium]